MTMSFSVIRSSQTLVRPCEPTPSDTLHLSSIDRVPGLRHMVRSLHVFKQGQEPAKVLREAVAKVLVPYYPFAGRIVDADDGEVQVACNAEGAWFVEASANCSLEDVKYLEHPLVIPEKDLLPDPPTQEADLNFPFMMQVTEFTCGGFVVGLACVHTLSDGLGAAQFLTAIGELARGRSRPTVEPVWSRELIPNSNPPKPQLSTGQGPPIFPSFKFQHANIDITPERIAQIKAQFFDRNGQHCSAFDVTMAKAWQSRTRAINLDDPDTDVQLCFFASTRHLLTKVLPPQGGYYGNCFYPVTVTAASGKVAGAELIEVVRLIREGKARLPVEFAKWAAGDFSKDPYDLTFSYNSLFVSDWTKLGFFEVDYGWGTPVHIVPFTYTDFMAVAILGAPPAPMKGVRLMTQCVEKEHFVAFQDQMSNFS